MSLQSHFESVSTDRNLGETGCDRKGIAAGWPSGCLNVAPESEEIREAMKETHESCA